MATYQLAGLDLPLAGAYATMALTGVVITLPNSPGLVGQFHWFTTLGLSLYMPAAVAQSAGLAYAIVLHGIQVVWYLAAGAISLAACRISFADMIGMGDADQFTARGEIPVTVVDGVEPGSPGEPYGGCPAFGARPTSSPP